MSTITKHKDYNEDRGYLLPINFSELDFEPKRMFVVNSVPPNDVRGNHAHHTTRQLLICTNGHVKVTLDNSEKVEVHLLSKGQSVVIPKLIWDTQEFLSIDSEIVVLSSTEYSIVDYITNYREFQCIHQCKPVERSGFPKDTE